MGCIVIAEDQAHIRRILKMWIARHGHNVLEAENGAIALELLRENAVDLLITDVNMPEMDGIELIGHAFEACPSLRGVFLVTSRCDQREILDSLHDDRVRVYPKPFSPSQLVSEVQKLLADGPPAAANASKGAPHA